MALSDGSLHLDVNNHEESTCVKLYDVIGWFAPVVIKMKILLQRLWESKVDWDEPVPEAIEDVWSTWRSQLKLLSQINVHR